MKAHPFRYLASRTPSFPAKGNWSICLSTILALGLNLGAMAANPAKTPSSGRFETGHEDNDTPDTLTIDVATQARAGLKTLTLEPYSYHPELTAVGNAVALQPLLDLRTRYLTALTEHDNAEARLTLAKQNVERTRLLQRGGVVSGRSLQEQQSQWLSEQALNKGSRLQIDALRNEAVLNWGKAIADLFLNPDPKAIRPYLSGQKTLLLVALPTGSMPVDTFGEIKVSRHGDRNRAEPARFISPAPQSDVLTQGESYFFETEHSNIRAGMRITAFIPLRQSTERGVLIPSSAVIRHLGQSFVYVKSAQDRFRRIRIAKLTDTHTGYFVTEGLFPGQEVVETGAQMLLSEEFRGQIPDEDDDD